MKKQTDWLKENIKAIREDGKATRQVVEALNGTVIEHGIRIASLEKGGRWSQISDWFEDLGMLWKVLIHLSWATPVLGGLVGLFWRLIK